MVVGTAVLGRPEEMNCSTAICAVASCIATRSAGGGGGGWGVKQGQASARRCAGEVALRPCQQQESAGRRRARGRATALEGIRGRGHAPGRSFR